MATRISPPANKEADPPPPPRRNAVPAPQFTPAAPLRQPAPPATAFAAAQTQRQKQRPVQQERAPVRERLGERAPSRDVNVNAGESRSTPASAGEEFETDAWVPSAFEGGHSDYGGAERGECKEDNALGRADEGSLDMEELAEELLPSTGDDGIFEVVLPNGKKMGVAVNIQPGAVRFHLSTSDEKLGERLRQRKMELRGHLERRIQRNVDITVL